MDFSLNEFQSMLDDSVEKFVSKEYDFETRQANSESELGYGAATWQTFCELGWTAMPFAEADGGLDGGPLETMLLMQQFGRGLVVEPYLANIKKAGKTGPTPVSPLSRTVRNCAESTSSMIGVRTSLSR